MPSETQSFASMWTALEPIGRHQATGGYRRFALTRTDAELREFFAGECAKRGMEVTLDRAGNQWAWWGDPDAGVAAGRPGVVTGSHLDSVPDGGAFDGPLGVVSALAAIDLLRERGVMPGRAVGVVCFGDEEGARFGVACAGSRIITGAMSADRARGLTDADGITMAEAASKAGLDPAGFGRDDETLTRVDTFVELHVEQGRGLDELERPVAVASSIWPHGRWRLDLAGQANHAGTTRLADRDDPMLALADVILTARSAAEQRGCVATVGKVVIEPNGINAIASQVTAWLDARGPVAGAVATVVAAVAEAGGVAAVEESFTPDTAFDPRLATELAGVLGDLGGPAPFLGTGAGHDAGILAAAGVRAAMLFVRNPTGISHSPAEHAEPDDCQAGVIALADVLEHLVQAPG